MSKVGTGVARTLGLCVWACNNLKTRKDPEVLDQGHIAALRPCFWRVPARLTVSVSMLTPFLLQVLAQMSVSQWGWHLPSCCITFPIPHTAIDFVRNIGHLLRHNVNNCVYFLLYPYTHTHTNYNGSCTKVGTDIWGILSTTWHVEVTQKSPW